MVDGGVCVRPVPMRSFLDDEEEGSGMIVDGRIVCDILAVLTCRGNPMSR
jgi:hypothetical protein